MTHYYDLDHLRDVTDPHDISRLDALDEIESLRSLGYSDAEIAGELGDDARVVLDELAAPAWSEDDSTDCDTW